MSHVQEQERKKMAKLGKSIDFSSGAGTTYTTPSRSMSTQTDTGPTDAVLAEIASGKGQDAGAGLVSLG